MAQRALSRPTIIALALIPINTLVWLTGTAFRESTQDMIICLFMLLSVVQMACCVRAIIVGIRRRRANDGGLADILIGAPLAIGSLVCGFFGSAIFGLAGGAWGRPLRVRGKQLHPSLREGADWTSGPRPDPREIDVGTRRALEALWLHDAQKEHASVPAFSRVSWLLAAAGAPAELLVWCHKAATEEIDHTQACFAVAAGYGARTFTVEPMPELLLGGLDSRVDPRITLAEESLSDGCQLEDFNADVAAACALVCEEPVTKAMLEKIAREERTHADLSWAILQWLVARHRDVVVAPIDAALAALDRYPRPTAVSHDKVPLVARADRAALRRHGRLDDAEWQAAWDARLVETRARCQALLALRQAA